jgi:hypothetical protein
MGKRQNCQEGKRICCKCKTEKPLTRDFFYTDKSKRIGFMYSCVECNKSKTRTGKRSNKNPRNNNIYMVLYPLQDGKCAICGRHEIKNNNRRLSIDHCHISGFVRALLCNQCNRALGLFKDDVTILERAVEYLKKQPTKFSVKNRVRGS